MSTEEEVGNAVITSLATWGVKHGQNEDQKAFRGKALTSALLAFNRGDETFNGTINSDEEDGASREENISDEELPEGLVKAFKYILCQELKSRKNRYSIAIDLLNHSTYYLPDIQCNPPYYYNWHRNRYEKNKKFEPFKSSELNPFHRFENRQVPRSLFFYNMFSDEMFLLGMGFEAAVSSHAMYTNQRCLHCSTEGSLEWNGGSNITSAWRDLVCTRCNSSYEIKSKATNDHIARAFKFNNTNGGSYDLFQKLKSRQSASGAKQYFVLVSRECTWSSVGSAYWQVHVAEIQCILPSISYGAFIHRNEGNVRFKSNVRVNLATRKKWFQVPAKKVKWETLARSVYEEHFSEEDWSSAEENLNAILSKQIDECEKDPAPLLPIDSESRVGASNDVLDCDTKLQNELEAKETLNAIRKREKKREKKEKFDCTAQLRKELDDFSEGVDDWEDLC